MLKSISFLTSNINKISLILASAITIIKLVVARRILHYTFKSGSLKLTLTIFDKINTRHLYDKEDIVF